MLVSTVIIALGTLLLAAVGVGGAVPLRIKADLRLRRTRLMDPWA